MKNESTDEKTLRKKRMKAQAAVMANCMLAIGFGLSPLAPAVGPLLASTAALSVIEQLKIIDRIEQGE